MDDEIRFLSWLEEELVRAARTKAAPRRAVGWRLQPSALGFPHARAVGFGGVAVLVLLAWVIVLSSGLLTHGIALGQPPHRYAPVLPAPAPRGSLLSAVAAVSADDVWAVGTSYAGSNPSPRGISLHWDGTVWHAVPTPPVGGLVAVSAAASGDVWAASGSSDSRGRALFLHWNGAGWRVVTGPPVPGAQITSIVAVSATDVWAVGSHYGVHYQNSCGGRSVGYRPLIEHWDGRAWSVIAAPDLPVRESELLSVAAIVPNDVWAVGQWVTNEQKGCTPQGTQRSFGFVEHWDGVRWRMVPAPNPGTGNNAFIGVAVVATNDVWLSGQFGPTKAGASEHPMFAHWGGSAWALVPSAPLRQGRAQALSPVSVSGAGPADVWAVGGGGFASDPLVEHWDGQHWTMVSSVGGLGALPWSVVAVSPSDAWLVGQYATAITVTEDRQKVVTTRFSPLIEHWDGRAWSMVSP